jgi:ferredoxin
MAIMSWFSLLSARQKSWLFGTVFVMLAIVGVGLYLTTSAEEPAPAAFTTDMSIQQVAPKLGVTGKALARELGLDLEIPKKKPLKALGVSDEKFQHAVEHLLSHRDANLKYFVYAALALGAVVFLVRLGRPDGAAVEQRKRWYPRAPYIVILLISVTVCGFLLGKSPNPMEGAVKVFKSAVGLYPDPTVKVLAFLFFIALAVAGNKVICGWACPFGALQELIYSLPILRRLKRVKPRFWMTNTIRAVLFLIVLLFLFGIIGGRKGLVIYHYINPFNLFNLDFDPVSIAITVGAVLAIALAVYRPFCQFICPFGLISWMAEKLSVCRVNVDQEKCTECGACIKTCPLEAAKGRVERKRFPADCFSCARCLNVCPVDAIRYGPPRERGE